MTTEWKPDFDAAVATVSLGFNVYVHVHTNNII